ncbi:hypothetical protein MTAT_20510 [Moorella thermoacetica]|uniref:Uncharacterized protein n=1 Tax=Neomoorella thermoacetica TaxID=1525 RepID=A0AAC9MVJ1_NEOTH|nr:hypothetical protein [Moorella thermoacetica]AOQ24706.1 hypothetical protein Maut_02278 [Moorella thermoacetica]TYL12809.1 hypothetical protein MTAT_20510 [Moorella thermoacetica]
MYPEYEVRRILNRHGYDVFYVRRDNRIKCVCNKFEPDPSCRLCLGTGFKIHLEKYRACRFSASIPESLVGVLKQEAPALVHPDAWVYYFEAAVKPKIRDLILETNSATLDASSTSVFIITAVEPMFFESGTPSFYRVIARSRYSN